MNRRDFLRAAGVVAIGVSARAGERSVQLPETIRVGIIGLEGHYSEITSLPKSLPNVRITALCDPNERTLNAARRNGALADASVWSDHRKMLATEKLDVVGVCGENGVRAPILRDCAEHVPAIISEKPLALTLADLASVRRTIERRHVALTMLLTMRFTPQFQAMRKIVAGGEIGDVVSMDAQKSYKTGDRPEWMKSRKTYGGSIPYIGVHMIDLMRWITGREMVEAAAFHSNVGVPSIREMENNAAVIFKLDNAGTATWHLDYQRPQTAPTHGDDRLRIVGTKGIVEFREGDGLTLLTEDKPLRKITDLPRARSLCVDFIESLHGGPPHQLAPADIFRVSEIVLKARAAADENKIVRL